MLSRRGAAVRGACARRVHLGRPGAADPQAAAHRHEGRSGQDGVASGISRAPTLPWRGRVDTSASECRGGVSLSLQASPHPGSQQCCSPTLPSGEGDSARGSCCDGASRGNIMHGRRPTISSTKGVVAAAHPLAAQDGAQMLAQGGNAVGAAAPTAAALDVDEPYMSGLAGAGLAPCWIAAEKRIKVLDFVPRVPASFPVERFTKREDLARGPLSVGVPGNLSGWAELVRAYGKKPLGD